MDFPKDFIWGTATAAYQVEGAYNIDGRGTSIWDTFSKTPGKIVENHNGDVACDQYHLYKDDVKLMKDCGIQSYRFSISWPRIFPNNTGELNPKGFDYYNNLITELLNNNIEPCVTLYHWDLPQYLEDKGGWGNRETCFDFVKYAETCFKTLGDRVKSWITFNEPWCISQLGYFKGEHAPGKQDKKLSLDVYHHLNLAHGLAVKKFRELKTGGKIGATLNLMLPRPTNNDPKNIEAANRVAITESRILLDPMYGKGYPKELTDLFKDYSFPIIDGDMELIAQPTDFIGINYYSEFAVKWDDNSPGNVGFDQSYQEKTDMDWPIVPQGLYRMMDYLRTNYNDPDIYITENGCAYKDEPNTDMTRCHDPKRIEYLKQHFSVIKKAIENGIKVKAYYLWSFIDNFEWAYGYTKRFGIVYCDYKTQKRIPKDSYYYYREVIGGFEDI